MHNIKLARYEYGCQRQASRGRGIEFYFTFDTWVKWWRANLGPNWQSLRGKGKGKYCMARKGDKGSYEPSNVDCVLFEFNSRQAQLGSNSVRAKINEATAAAIYLDEGTNQQIADKFEVHESIVRAIKRKNTWNHVTDGLVCAPRMSGPCGELSGNLKLREYEVLFIFYSTQNRKILAKIFEVRTVTIDDIRSKRRWAHLTVSLDRSCPPPIRLRKS